VQNVVEPVNEAGALFIPPSFGRLDSPLKYLRSADSHLEAKHFETDEDLEYAKLHGSSSKDEILASSLRGPVLDIDQLRAAVPLNAFRALAVFASFVVLGSPIFSSDFALAAEPTTFERAELSAENFEKVAGFEDFAAQGGKMSVDPSCFFKQCEAPTKNCFTNPSCLKGITCLGNCRGEQLCATQCFARFGSEKLNSWLSCTLEEKECVTTGVKQDTSTFYASPPPAMTAFTPADLEGKWYKVLGYNPKYDTYPCQINTFTSKEGGALENDILFRVPKPDGSGSWQNNFIETLENSKGPQGKASMTVEGKMFGLTFHEQWYVLGKGDGYRVVAYIGDTQQGPYDGAFVYTKDRDALVGPNAKNLRAQIDNVVRGAGFDPSKMVPIDNSCPADTTKAGVSAADASKEKLEWKDVYELTEWFRPGTVKKDTSFDPTKM
jgi:hypothetical protein